MPNDERESAVPRRASHRQGLRDSLTAITRGLWPPQLSAAPTTSPPRPIRRADVNVVWSEIVLRYFVRPVRDLWAGRTERAPPSLEVLKRHVAWVSRPNQPVQGIHPLIDKSAEFGCVWGPTMHRW
jgi:hypothetical protein